jgi:hypothetical protein
MRQRLLCLILAGIFTSCNPPDKQTGKSPTGRESLSREEKLISEAKEAQGSQNIYHQKIRFRFRDRTYTAYREPEGRFIYTRAFREKESGDTIRDVLTQEGFYRMRNLAPDPISSKDSAAYSNSVNSVLYFALLPYNLDDPAVIAEYIGQSEIEGRVYDKLKVVFRKEGGGKDYEDEFVYWFEHETHTLDYLAYNYLTDGGGARFRKALNPREIGGIRFQDYINYRPVPDNRNVSRFDSLFLRGEMEEISRIELEGIQVMPHKPEN